MILQIMLDLSLVKKHLNIESEFTDDDFYICNLIEVAEEAVKNAVMPDSPDDLLDEDGDYLPNVRHAILLLIGTWYANRESVAYGIPNKVPHGFDFLIQQIKTYHF
jgi:uncharacterized phage protein (predicted DNA packaging)